MIQEKKERLLIEKLKEDLALLKEAINILKHSHEKCQKIGVKENLNLDELESFESLTARFARASDILTQKIFKAIIALSLEDIQTFIDRLNYMEKVNIIESAQTFKEIRKIRNTVAHEYIVDDLNELFKDVLTYSKILFKTVDKIETFIKTKFLSY
jgi:uncharacterized protein YutE (UPF0331/DUF86 family)